MASICNDADRPKRGARRATDSFSVALGFEARALHDRRPLRAVPHGPGTNIDIRITFAVRRLTIGAIATVIVGMKIVNNKFSVFIS